MTETSPPLRVTGLTVRFGGLSALSGVDLVVSPGDIVAVVGPNGAGKTTLLNAICGLSPKVGGTIEHFDADIGTFRPDRIAREGIARSFQNPQLLEDETVLESLLCGAHLTMGYGLFDQLHRRGRIRRREDEMRSKALDLLTLVGLEDLAKRRASELAYGSRKLIDIIRAVMPNPGLLLLDEPSSGLDQVERGRLQEVLLLLHAERKLPMLVVEHHMDLVRAISDELVGLVSGGVALAGPAKQILDSPEFDLILDGIPDG